MARIVSFLPSATEMACALGLADSIVGITHECDYPPEIKSKPVVVRNVLPIEKMSQSEIDRAVADRIARGPESLRDRRTTPARTCSGSDPDAEPLSGLCAIGKRSLASHQSTSKIAADPLAHAAIAQRDFRQRARAWRRNRSNRRSRSSGKRLPAPPRQT